MDPTEIDPTDSLGQKLTDFAAGLTDAELSTFYDVLDQAAQRDSDVEGFAYQLPTGLQADPCEGGEIASLQTFSMLGSVMQNLVDTRGAQLRPRRR